MSKKVVKKPAPKPVQKFWVLRRFVGEGVEIYKSFVKPTAVPVEWEVKGANGTYLNPVTELCWEADVMFKDLKVGEVREVKVTFGA